MTKRIEEILNLPSMAELIDENHVDDTERYVDQSLARSQVDDPDDSLMDPQAIAKHEKDMDEIHGAAMTAHKDAIDLAFNMEAKNAGSIMEPAARFLELAMKASQSKFDARAKSMKMRMDREKLDAELKKNQDEGVVEGDQPSEAGYMADRNQLLARLREQQK